MQARLKKYATLEAHVPFPMRGSGDEDSSWLSDEAYQTYSIRAGTAPWQESLRRQVLLYRFRQLNPDNGLNKAIWQPRLQKRYLKEDEKLQKIKRIKVVQRRERRSREGSVRGDDDRRRDVGDRSDEEDDFMDVDHHHHHHHHRGGSDKEESSSSALALLPLGGGAQDPVAKQRNSTLSRDEHRQFLALETKLRRFRERADDARPLTSEERATLQRLGGLVQTEKDKYWSALRRWVDGSRAPYKALDRSIASKADSYLSSIKDAQKAALAAKHPNWPLCSREPMPVFAPQQPGGGGGGFVVPAFLGLVRTAPRPMPLTLPAHLPLDLAGREDTLSPPAVLFPRVEEWMREDEEADVVVGLRTLLAMADPTVSWTVPFENLRRTDEEEKDGNKKLLTVIRPPLLPAVLSLRDMAELYLGRLVRKALGSASSDSGGGGGEEETEEEAAMTYETWQLSERFKVMVGSERIKLSQEGGKAEVVAEEALLEVDLDYCLDFSQEDRDSHPSRTRDSLRRMLFSWAAVSCPVYTATIDGKTGQLVKVEETPFTVGPEAAAPQVEMLTFLRVMIAAMVRRGEGRFLAQLRPDSQELIIYKESGGGGEGSLEVAAYVEESGQRDQSAWSSFIKWKWPATAAADHIRRHLCPGSPSLVPGR